VRRCDEQVRDDVLLADAHPLAPLAAAPLRPVVRHRGPLDVTGVADRDRHVLVGDQVLDAELAFLLDDLGPPRVAEPVADLAQFVHDNLRQQRLARQDRAEALDERQHLSQLVDDLLPLQAGQPLELHVEDRLGLHLAEGEGRHQAVARLGHRLRRADEGDHRVEVIEGDLQPLEDMGTRLALRNSYSVRRRTTSRRKSTKRSITDSGSTRGRPPTIASMMIPNDDCSWVCL
jgi:hypothetical protein